MSSSSAGKLFGSPAGGLEGVCLLDLVESPGRSVVAGAVERVAEATSTTERVATTLRSKENAFIDADLHISATGDPGQILVCIRVVDDRRVSPVKRMDDTSDSVHQAVAICQEGRIREASDELASMVGVAPDMMIGWRLKGLVSSIDLLPVVSLLHDVESGRRPVAEFGFHLLRANDLSPLEVTARVRGITRGGRPALLVGVEDVSERVQVARAATEALGHLDAALDATSDAVLIVGASSAGSRITYASRSFERLFGVEAREWLGRPFMDLWKRLRPLHEVPGREEEAWRRLLEDNAATKLERVRLSGPPERVIERCVRPLKETEGRVIGRICSFRDVTTRTLSEEKMRRGAEEARKAREELAQLHEETRLANEGLEMRMTELQRLNMDLKTLDEMKSNLLANVSHELQTPLVSIKGFTEMILKGTLGEVNVEQQEGLEVALRNINRLIGLIDNLMAYARSREPADVLRLGVFHLDEIIHETVRLVEESARRRDITISVDVPEKLMVRADRDRIVQVILNLMTNAIKYNNDGGSVTVHANKRGDTSVRFSVTDTGVGIPREEIEKIFERDYRAQRTRDSREGEGIGLSIAHDILRRHGSLMRVETSVGIGSTFSFTLPLEVNVAGPVDAAARTSEPPQPKPR